MGQRRNTESVRNFVIFLLILQNCGQARTQPEIRVESEQETEAEQELETETDTERRDGLAKFEFSGKQPVKDDASLAPLNVFNFAKIYETFHAQLMQTAAGANRERGRNHGSGRGRGHGHSRGRGLRTPQAQLMWEPQSEEDEQVVLVTSPKPFHVVQRLHQDLEEKRKHSTTTVKPFSILQQLAMEQAEHLRNKRPNISSNLLGALQMEQEMWDKQTTTVKPFHMVQQLQQELEELQKHRTTVKPYSVLEHLVLQQAEELRKKAPNASFNIMESLNKEQEKLQKQTTTVKPFHLAEQLNQELDKHVEAEEDQEEAFEVLQPVTQSLEQHKSVPQESTRAKESNKRKRKRIRRRRKRKRRRGKRKRRRTRKKRKKKRKKKGDKDKKKRRKKKRRKKPTPTHDIIGQQAQLIYANPTKQPYHSHPYPHPPHPQIIQIVTTKRPTAPPAPFSKIKYLLRHNTLFKKKKKEWFSHVGHVLYPFIKFVAFFTVLNPFTLGVFLFTLISPAVFGFLGFVALSVLVKPFLHLVFGVKNNVNAIDRKRYLANKRAEQLKLNLRPVTIHKHFYQQKPLHSTPPHRYRPVVNWRRHTAPNPPERHYNPLLPTERAALANF